MKKTCLNKVKNKQPKFLELSDDDRINKIIRCKYKYVIEVTS